MDIKMESGMLWFDNEPRLDLLTKIQKAANYYKNKYGEEANQCFIHPSMLPEEQPDTRPITLHLNNTVLPHHFWIGVWRETTTNP